MSAALALIAAAVLTLPGTTARGRLLPTGPAHRMPIPPVALAAATVMPAGLIAWLAGVEVTAAVVILACTLALRYQRSYQRVEQDRAIDMLTAGLEVVIAELKVGAHPASACESAALESLDNGIFAAAAARARLGGSAAAAILATDGPAVAVTGGIGRVWALAESHGLALATLLDASRVDILGRRRFARRTQAALAGARATALALAALPVLGIALGQMMGAAPLSVLLGGGLGGILLLIGTTLVCAGLLWTDRITAGVGP